VTHYQGQKHYSKQTVYDAHLKSAKHQKKEQAGNPVPDPATTNGSPAPVATSSSSSRDKLRPAARLTYLVTALLAFPPIPQILLDSRSEVERRMALTAREREAELERNEEAAPPPPEINPQDDEEEEDDGKIYNPLKLPLG
jgi:splicing factor 3A subunit 3